MRNPSGRLPTAEANCDVVCRRRAWVVSASPARWLALKARWLSMGICTAMRLRLMPCKSPADVCFPTDLMYRR